MFIRILQRDLILTWRQRGEWLNSVLFFVIVVSLFPLGIGTDKAVLLTIAPGVIWIAALLASLLSLPQLFRQDFLDGSLEQLILQPYALPGMVGAKILAHWLSHQLPLIIIAPLIGLFFQLSGHAIAVLLVTLLLGTAMLSLLGAIIAALTVGVRGGDNILLPLLLLPLLVPVLIFATSAVLAAEAGLAVSGQLAILGALFLLALCFAPLAASAALRVGVE